MKKSLAIAAVVVLALTGALVAHASVPSADGTITACLNGEHAVRVIDGATSTCSGGETELQWLANGGKVYEDHTLAAQSLASGATVARVTVPAGRYLVSAKTWVQNLGSGTINYQQCGLTGLATNENARATLAPNAVQTLAVLGTVDVATTTDIELFCGAANAEAGSTVLTATSVSAIQ